MVKEGFEWGMGADGTHSADVPFRESDLTYIYTVFGKTFDFSRYSFSAGGWLQNNTYYQEGGNVLVYYDPANPALAVLQPGLRSGIMLGPVIMTLGIAGFFLILL